MGGADTPLWRSAASLSGLAPRFGGAS